jgi:hypothetical protein
LSTRQKMLKNREREGGEKRERRVEREKVKRGSER